MEYQIVIIYDDSDEFENRVNNLLKDNWQCQGGVNISHYQYKDEYDNLQTGIAFAQAMVKV